MFRKLLCLMLTAAFVFVLLPAASFAASDKTTPAEQAKTPAADPQPTPATSEHAGDGEDPRQINPNIAPPSLDDALNVEGGTLHFESTGDYPWFVAFDGFVAPAEEDSRLYAMSGNAGVDSSVSVLTTTMVLDGRTAVSFDFKAWGEGTSYYYYDTCQFAVDGTVVHTWNAYQNEEWETFVSDVLPAGEHTLTWTYEKDGNNSWEGDCFMVDDVELIGAPSDPTLLDDALNIAGGTLHFESTGDYPWFVASDEETGRLYAMSGNAGVDSSVSVLTTTMVSDGRTAVRFDFKAWGEGISYYWDTCQFAVDGTVVQMWNAYQNEEWETFVTDALPAGEHTLTWTYEKDDNNSWDGDFFMVDDVWLICVTSDAPTNLINEINIINFVEPTWGAAPNYNVSVPEGAHYRIEDVVWLRNYNGQYNEMAAGDTFSDPNAAYSIRVELVPEEGYLFDRYGDGVVSMLNGEANLADGPHYLEDDRVHVRSIEYTVSGPTESQPPVTVSPEHQIDTIELIGFVEPEWGAAPSCNVTVPEGANYTIAEQNWYYYAGTIFPLHDGDVFNVIGRRYLMDFRVIPAEGYAFVGNPIVTINGSEDFVSGCMLFDNGSSCGIYTIDFTVSDPTLIEIDTVEILDFDVPIWGGHPDFTVSVPNGVPYSIAQVQWSPAIDADYVFNNPSTNYYASFNLVAAEGYAFSSNVAVTIRGGTEQYTPRYTSIEQNGRALFAETVALTVTAPPSAVIDTIEILDFVEPVWGAAPSCNVTVPEGANYTIVNNLWLKGVGYNYDSYEPMLDGELFNDESLLYIQAFEIEPAEGYLFAPEPTFTINGEPAPVGFASYGFYYASVYTIQFSVSEPPAVIDTIEILGFVEPVWGAAPSYNVTVPEGANYTIVDSPWGKGVGDDYDNYDTMLDGELFNDESLMYAQGFAIKPAEGYAFAPELTFTINGETTLVGFASFSSVYGIVITVPFSVNEPSVDPIFIDTIEITDLELPEWGAHPDFEVSVPDGAPYTVTAVKWRMDAAPYELNANDVFDDPNENYRFVIEIVHDEGYCFSYDTVVTVNGSTDILRTEWNQYASADRLFRVYSYGFTVEEPAPTVIDTVEILGFTEPVFGEHPDFDIYAPDGAHYAITSMNWFGDMVNGEISPDFTFVAGSYYAVFSIEPEEGYVFSENVGGTIVLINGSGELYGEEYSSVYEISVKTVTFYVEEPAAPLYGDANGDGEVIMEDVLLLQRYLMNLVELEEANLQLCDVDGDGEVTMLDALLIMRRIMQIISHFPVEEQALRAF